jgi:phosphoesterase RecJ-like protein
MSNMYEQIPEIKDLVSANQSIVIVQADNPDADSLGSALALEHILGDLGKQTYMYCGIEMPTYLRYLSGWDRVTKELPNNFDLSIIVDASTMTLLERLSKDSGMSRLASKPCIVLDHHEIVEQIVPFSKVMINDHKRASTGELIYIVASELKWPLSKDANLCIMASILGDTQGLSNQLATAETYRIMAAIIESGVNRPELEELRRQFGKMPDVIYKYKADLIKRTEFVKGNQIAWVMIPQTEISNYSPLYNPAPLIQPDMLQIEDVRVAIVFKSYDDGKVTAAIRTNPTASIAADLADSLGGGGHAFASGFKVTDGRSFEAVKKACLDKAVELLNALDKEAS